MRPIDKTAQVIGSAVTACRRKECYSVIAPIAAPRKIRDRHQLHCRNAQIQQIGQPSGSALKCSFRREGADMEFIENQILPSDTPPGAVVPGKCAWINHLGWSMNAIRLEPGGGVRKWALAVYAIAIEVAGTAIV